MIETFLLYISMAGFGYLWLKQIVRFKSKSSLSFWLKTLFPLLILSVIIGGRYFVGTDWENYAEYYRLTNPEILKSIGILFTLNLEPFFILLMSICKVIGFSDSMFFTIIALGIFLLVLGGHNDKRILLPLILFFYFGQMFYLSMNIIRQIIAISIFFFSLQYFGKARAKMLICIACAVLFHYSSIILFAALLLERQYFNFLDKRYIILFVFIVTYFVGIYLVGYITEFLPLEYFSDKYVRSANNLSAEMELSSGLGILTKKIVDVIMILYSAKVIAFFVNEKFKYVYRLYFVGIILANIVGVSVYLSRLILGFELLRIYILSYFCYYAFKQMNLLPRFIASLIILWSILGIFMGVMNGNSGCSPYQFLWQ